MKTAVLLSGRGSNLKAILDASQSENYPAKISLVISNRASASGLDYARADNIPVKVIDHTGFETRDDFDKALDEILKEHKIELVCLAGFMRLLGRDFVMGWKDKLINIHPSLLPAYKGLNTHARALKDGVRFVGATVHFVRAEMDDGPIIAQSVVPVHKDDTASDLAERVLKAEHRLFPAALKLVASRRVRVSGHRVLIEGAESADVILTNPIL